QSRLGKTSPLPERPSPPRITVTFASSSTFRRRTAKASTEPRCKIVHDEGSLGSRTGTHPADSRTSPTRSPTIAVTGNSPPLWVSAGRGGDGRLDHPSALTEAPART